MKKIFLLLSLTILLSGCYANENNDGFKRNNDNYKGKNLDIGVVGNELPDISNVNYRYVKLNEIFKNNNINFDALIITSDEFEEADNPKYVQFFDKVTYPVIFFGEKDFRMFAFTNENMSIENSKDNNDSFIEGFRNIDDEREGMKFYKFDENDTDVDMLVRLFNYLDNLD